MYDTYAIEVTIQVHIRIVNDIIFFFKQKTAYEMRISDWKFRRVLFRSQFGVNHLGTFAFTGLIHRHVDDRIVVTASLAHKGGAIDYSDLAASRSYHNWQRYQTSKLDRKSTRLNSSHSYAPRMQTSA